MPQCEDIPGCLLDGGVTDGAGLSEHHFLLCHTAAAGTAAPHGVGVTDGQAAESTARKVRTAVQAARGPAEVRTLTNIIFIAVKKSRNNS